MFKHIKLREKKAKWFALDNFGLSLQEILETLWSALNIISPNSEKKGFHMFTTQISLFFSPPLFPQIC